MKLSPRSTRFQVIAIRPFARVALKTGRYLNYVSQFSFSPDECLLKYSLALIHASTCSPLVSIMPTTSAFNVFLSSVLRGPFS